MSNHALGAALIVGQMLAFASESTIVHLIGSDVTVAQFSLLRNFGGLLMVALLARHQGISVFKTTVLPLQLLRSGLGIVHLLIAMFMFVQLPLSIATAISYNQSFFMLLFGALLGEQLRTGYWLSVGLGTIGALLITKPAIDAWSWVYLISLSGPILNAAVIALNKRMERHDPALTIMVYVSTVGTIISAILCIGQPLPDVTRFWWLLPPLLILGPLGQYLGILAVRHADVAALAPYIDVRLPIAAALGLIVFGEIRMSIALSERRSSSLVARLVGQNGVCKGGPSRRTSGSEHDPLAEVSVVASLTNDCAGREGFRARARAILAPS